LQALHSSIKQPLQKSRKKKKRINPLGVNEGRQRKYRICRVSTVPWLFHTLLLEQLRSIVLQGGDLTLVSSPEKELWKTAADIGAKAYGIPMERAPSPISDLRSFFHLWRFLRRQNFNIVHSTSPKAGFLSAIASALARVPVRLHTFTGQPWVEMSGWRRCIAWACDRITALLATKVYADSASQKKFLIDENVVQAQKIEVIGHGSIAGVDLRRFSPKKWGGDRRNKTRSESGIPSKALVIVFIGRVTQDKGIVELVTAFSKLAKRNHYLHLMLVGPLEPERDPLPPQVLLTIKNHPRIHALGFSHSPEKFLGAADIFCLPSYREGFGSVAIEAAAMGLPVVVTRIVGLVDAVEADVTARLVPPKDAAALAMALKELAESPELRARLGSAGRRRAAKLFNASKVNTAVIRKYLKIWEETCSRKTFCWLKKTYLGL